MSPLPVLALLVGCDASAPGDTGSTQDEPLRATWFGPEGAGRRFGRFLASPRNGEVFYAGEDPPGFWCDSGCIIDDSGGEAWEADPGATGDVWVEEAATARYAASQPVPLPPGTCPEEPCVLFGLGKPADVLLVSGSAVISELRPADPQSGFLSAVGLADFGDWSGIALYWQPIGSEGSLALGVQLLDIERLTPDVVVDTVEASLSVEGFGSWTVASTQDYSGDGISDLSTCLYSGEVVRYMCVVAEGPWSGDRHAETADAWFYDVWHDIRSDAPAPDFDGDGYADLYLMSSDFDRPRVGLFLGPVAGFVEFDGADSTIRDSGAEAAYLFPRDPGDVDGDGLPDLLVGASINAAGSDANAGVVYVLLGPFHATRDLSEAALVLRGTEEDGFLGSDMTGLGDVDGDGDDEFAIADVDAHAGDGAVYVYGYPSP